jgi:hypothetical protein
MDKARQSATIAQLKSVFGVQIPPTTDDMVIRRLFTIAARDQYSKINPQVAEMLESIGAKVPRVHKDMVSCHGVLYQPQAKQCQACGLNKSCQVEAANLGLTRITLSPRLLGSRQVRSPVILATFEETRPVAASYDEAEIVSYLEDSFTLFKRKDEFFYGLNAETAEKQQQLLFGLGSQTLPLRLRFCSPSEEMKSKLVLKGKGWYPPEGMATPEVIELIDQHSTEAVHA